MIMRQQLLKLRRGKSTKSERIFSEILKELHIKYICKAKIEGREIDFLCGKYAIEINGHPQKLIKNSILLEKGYIPLNINNEDILNNRESIKQQIKLLYDNSTNNSNIINNSRYFNY